jgi:hypothetical protein
MISKCESCHRVSLGNDRAVAKKCKFRGYGHHNMGLYDPKTFYLLRCFKCHRTVLTDDSLALTTGNRLCGHGFDNYSIHEELKVYLV